MRSKTSGVSVEQTQTPHPAPRTFCRAMNLPQNTTRSRLGCTVPWLRGEFGGSRRQWSSDTWVTILEDGIYKQTTDVDDHTWKTVEALQDLYTHQRTPFGYDYRDPEPHLHTPADTSKAMRQPT